MPIIDKIVAYTMAVVIICFVPLICLSLKSEQNIQSYVDDKVNEFVDNACATGIITASSYERMVNQLDSTGLIYDIYMIHSNGQMTPEVDEDGNIIPNSISKYKSEMRNEEIFAVLFPDNGDMSQPYYMKEGDYFRVIIENTQPTIGTRLLSMFYIRGDYTSIQTNAGNYVGNEIDIR